MAGGGCQPLAADPLANRFEVLAPATNDVGTSGDSENQSADPKREYLWDNVRGICSLGLVLLHSVTYLCGMKALEGPFVSGLIGISLFVLVPGFVFVSGHLSSADMSRAKLRSLMRLWVVAILQQAVWTLFVKMAKSSDSEHQGSWPPFALFSTIGDTWFLLCLALWRTLLPVLHLLRWPVWTSILVSVSAPLLDSSRNSLLQPALVFLPIFLGGFYATPRMIRANLNRVAARIFSFCIVLNILMSWLLPVLGHASMWGTGFANMKYNYFCLHGESEAKKFTNGGCERWQACMLPLFCIANACGCLQGIFSMLPKRRVWGLSQAGQTSLYIYVLHPYLLLPLAYAVAAAAGTDATSDGWPTDTGILEGRLAMPTAIGVAVVLWAVLGQGWAQRVCSLFAEPAARFCMPLKDVESTSRSSSFQVPFPVSTASSRA